MPTLSAGLLLLSAPGTPGRSGLRPTLSAPSEPEGAAIDPLRLTVKEVP